MRRVLLVSNRLPVTITGDASPSLTWSAGGLATGLRRVHANSNGLWIGWAGQHGPPDADVNAQLAAMRLVPVSLTREDVEAYYESFSNGVLWPLLHYLMDRIPASAHDWDSYHRVNQLFADAVLAHLQPDDVVWVHDYQLMLVPEMIRRRAPHARIGFFLHVPFPAPEVFSTLPWRDEMLLGLLGADVVGFHTLGYLRNFAQTLQKVLGMEVDMDRALHGGRSVHLGAFPIGVEAEEFEALARHPDVRARASGMLEGSSTECIILGVDRLDYTKGIPRRLMAIDRLLERNTSLHGRVRMIQVAVPSREKVPAYEDFHRQVNELVGRINSRHGTASWVPVHYLYRSVSREELVAMYVAADIMLVTPLRDGMNLVAKEYVASRTNDDGVLILSEFAGAAEELGEAVLVNPYDVAGVAGAIQRALDMSSDERVRRMRALRDRVRRFDIHHWASSFLAALDDALEVPSPDVVGTVSAAQLLDVVTPAGVAPAPVTLLLDYDGTLVPHVSRPELATPDPELRAVLQSLASAPGIRVAVVSGRRSDDLARWFSELPIGLHAEHGFTSRATDGTWQAALASADLTWIPRVATMMEEFTARVPGSIVERKGASVAWHWRGVDPGFGATRARELQQHLSVVLSNAPVQVLRGDRVVEVRVHGVSKALVARPVAAACAPGERIVALGNDFTDEDMFKALPPEAITVRVGPGETCARYRLASVREVRRFLALLVRRHAATTATHELEVAPR
ncbi:MAG: bifunctional alpha,alpha-trehalose-phosphate synthase (UDP-forming)/trehalose-phosphatase [Myxococcota bacterium]